MFREIFIINGRLNRKKFILYWVLASVSPLIIMMLLYSLEKALSLSQSVIGLIVAISLLAGVVAHICLAIRRLHDIERHGALVIGLFIPIINIILNFYLFFTKGTVGYNYYGPDPLELH
ncbi:DUF805 domain-containing protein [Propionispira raffinosivorans]|uniref:DUF805 domain-containing protein n=1 Tax=Propionispira raffinosivorans TaxID=86959 RepID=UPI0003795E70|nr:DUF805 domain-containing protein [Propionispira raffinosivorans]